MTQGVIGALALVAVSFHRSVCRLCCCALLLLVNRPLFADNTPQPLPFTQDWTNTGLITMNDDWSGVPGIVGYRGDNLTSAPGADPQTIVFDGTTTPVDVNANQSNPDTFPTGGVAEFDVILNPTIAVQGSGIADAPFLLINLNTSGAPAVNVSYNLRDIDGSSDDAAQPVALQYRVGSTGDFTNLPAGFVADATTPNQATQVFPVNVTLPADANDQPLVQVRIITANAVGNDEWVGIDDIIISQLDASPYVANTSPADGATQVPRTTNINITFNEPVNVSGTWYQIQCDDSGAHTAAVSGGPTTYTLNPDVDFSANESCTTTVFAAGVTDQDTDDPPDNMTADYDFSFETEMILLQRTFVSAAGGNDANPCSRALPCRQFGEAMTKTSWGGEVIVLDSGGYGAVNIGRAVSIISPAGVYAGITAFSGNAITVNVTYTSEPTDHVALRGLTLQALGGANGVHFTLGKTLLVESCLINGFASAGIRVELEILDGQLIVTDTIVRNGTLDGVTVNGSAGVAVAAATLDHVLLENNGGAGVVAGENSQVLVRGSTSSGNAVQFLASSSGPPSILDIEKCLAIGNGSGTGIQANLATIRVSNSTITNNAIGVDQGGGATIVSRGNNTLEGNAANNTFPSTFAPK